MWVSRFFAKSLISLLRKVKKAGYIFPRFMLISKVVTQTVACSCNELKRVISKESFKIDVLLAVLLTIILICLRPR